MKDNILFFSVVDDSPIHQQFVFPFIASALITHPGAACEVLVSNADMFQEEYSEEIKSLEGLFPESLWQVRQWPLVFELPSFSSQSCPGAFIRFLTFPHSHVMAKHNLIKPMNYTYISDIDMLFIEDILPIHKTVMEATGLPYTNIIRPDTKRMTGCMMVKSKEYYDAMTPIIDKYIANPESIYYPIRSDEELLYALIRRSSLPLPNIRWDPNTLRPIPAIHTSANREIDTVVKDGIVYPSWGCLHAKLVGVKALFEVPEWQGLVLPEEYIKTVVEPLKEKMEDALK